MSKQNVLSRFNPFPFVRQVMLVTGVAAITVLVLMFVKPELTQKLQAISPFSEKAIVVAEPDQVKEIAAADTPEPDANPKSAPEHTQQQKVVADWLAKRYRIASDAAHLFVSAAFLTAHEFKLDPLLILSVMAIESGFNPYAESPVGAQGLMQVMSRIHKDKFEKLGGIKAALDPVANIRVGSQILKEYVTRGGSVKAGLKMYVGAALAKNDGGYGSKVLAEYRRLKEVSDGKSVSAFATTKAPVVATAATLKVNSVNAKNAKESEILTTGKNEQISERYKKSAPLAET